MSEKGTDYREAGMDVYGLNIQLGATQGDSVLSAIEAAVQAAQRTFTRETRDDLLVRAEAIEADYGSQLYDDGVAALIWYAACLDETLPYEEQLENDGNDRP
jgi:hypothetical protein